MSEYIWPSASCRFEIPRRWVVRAPKTKETGIAIDAAERPDSNCAQKMLLHGTAPMRSIDLRTTATWTESFEVRLHSLHHVPDFRFRQLKAAAFCNMVDNLRAFPPARRGSFRPALLLESRCGSELDHGLPATMLPKIMPYAYPGVREKTGESSGAAVAGT